MRNITLVTGFFDIGRGAIENESLKRSSNTYFSYFEHWARIKNKLIVYVDSQNVERVRAIRNKYLLSDKTVIIAVDNIFAQEYELYMKMKKVAENEHFRRMRYYSNAMSNSADYDYLMLMKAWMLFDAYKRNLIEDGVAWIDFGFDHGGVCYAHSEEFDFEWQYEFSNKIHIFCLTHPDCVHVFESVQLLFDCIMGAPIYLPGKLTEVFWGQMKQMMETLVTFGCIDDDQQLMLMIYKNNPELFEVHISNWFLPLKEYGGEHLTVKTQEKRTVIENSVLRKIKLLIKILRKQDNNFNFAKRMYDIASEHYRR